MICLHSADSSARADVCTDVCTDVCDSCADSNRTASIAHAHPAKLVQYVWV